jgi:hypothetical protein
LLGSFILTTITNGANLLNVNAFWQRRFGAPHRTLKVIDLLQHGDFSTSSRIGSGGRFAEAA